MKPSNHLRWLNAGNETGLIQLMMMENLIAKFPNEEIIGLEIGSAYGGGVEAMARLLKGHGKYYGYDTFEGHPKDLAIPEDGMAEWCMDMWYEDPRFGTKNLAYDYQRRILDENGLDNAILVKGRINEHSFDDIEKIHFAVLDLDLIIPMKIAYKAIRDKFSVGGYLLIHDALPEDHLPMINTFVYKQILAENGWKIIAEAPKGNLTALEKWKFTIGDLNGTLLNINER